MLEAVRRCAVVVCATAAIEASACGAAQPVAPTSPPDLRGAAARARHVLIPDHAIFVLSDRGALTARDVPAVSLGGSGAARILLHFSLASFGAKPPSAESVEAAFIVLDRAGGASAGPADVTLRVSAIDELWSTGPAGDRSDPTRGMFTTWARPPNAHLLADGTQRVVARASGSIRVDVTPFAIALLRSRGVGTDAAGLRIEASSLEHDDGDAGVPIATGGAGGEAGPRLEIYAAAGAP